MKLETKAMNTFINPPTLWCRYVDDTMAKILKTMVEQFMQHLNSQHPRIKFTSEELQDKKLAFLDSEINVKDDGNVKLKIYRKPTHTDQYLNYKSNHHVSQKLGIVATLKHRINTIVTEEEDKKEEEETIEKALKGCSYPDWAVKRKKKERKPQEECRGKVVIPYIKKTSEKIAQVYKRFNVRTRHKPTRKLHGYVCNAKTPTHPLDRAGAVYEVECTRHKEDYTGETDRAIKARGYEHRVISHKDSEISHTLKRDEPKDRRETGSRRSKRNVKRKDYKKMDTGSDILITEGNTEVSAHMAKEHHEPGDVTIKAITYDDNWYTRGIREAIKIKKRNPTLNADEGRYFLSAIYDNLF